MTLGRRAPTSGILFALCLAAASCKTIAPEEVNRLYQEELKQRDGEYRIKGGDTLAIKLFATDPGTQFNQILQVLPDGRTDPFFMDNLVVAGKTVRQLEEEVERVYAPQVRSPEVAIQVTPAPELIYLHGQVEKPGTQPYVHGMTLSHAIANANGYKVTASADEVVLKRSYRNPRRPDRFVVSLYEDSEAVFLLPGDEIIVDPTAWILVRDYLQEYLWGLLPVSYLQALLFGGAAF